MQFRRRSLLTEPDEHLLLPPSFLGANQRLESWCAYTGMSPDDVLHSPLVSVPLPLAATIPPGRRRWDGIRPEAMWHPLLWLPPRVTSGRQIRVEETGRTWREGPDEWAVRVALELSESAPIEVGGRKWVRMYNFAGANFVRPVTEHDRYLVDLYDPHTGTWLDVLSTVGLDTDDPADLARVERWLEGAPDPALDAIDLERLLLAGGRNPDWALDRTHRLLDDTESGGTARSYIEDVRDASTTLVAQELAVKAADLTEVTSQGLEWMKNVMVMLTSLAEKWTSLVGPEAEDLSYALDQITVRAHHAPDVPALVEVAHELSALMGALVEDKADSIDRLGLRLQIETLEILDEIEQIHTTPAP